MLCPTPGQRRFTPGSATATSGSASASRCIDIPDLPQERDPAFRRIHQFDELWKCSALRMMENSFDNSHFSFVHKGTFGDIASQSRRNTS